MSFDRFFDKLRQWRRPWVAGTEPLEIHRALLEDIEAQVVAVGGGRRVLPFDRVEVKLLALTPEEAVRLEAIAQSAWDLESEVKERFKAQGVRYPADLAIPIEVSQQRGAEFGDRRYAVAFRRSAAPVPLSAAPTGAIPGAEPPPPRPSQLSEPSEPSEPVAPLAQRGSPVVEASTGRQGPREARPVLRLAVLKGKAVRDAYDLTAERVYLGRLEEVLDPSGRVKRRNDVAFVEEGDLEHTVSREHARIAWDSESRSFWLRDEGSVSGTLIFRAGRSIEVSRHDRRGVRLETGDEIYLGRASLKVEIAGGLRRPQ